MERPTRRDVQTSAVRVWCDEEIVRWRRCVPTATGVSFVLSLVVGYKARRGTNLTMSGTREVDGGVDVGR